MNHYISLAVAALLGYTNGINIQSTSIIHQEQLNEHNRYIGAGDKPINLAETTGHFRL
jgi:hypothetical protein